MLNLVKDRDLDSSGSEGGMAKRNLNILIFADDVAIIAKRRRKNLVRWINTISTNRVKNGSMIFNVI